MTLRIGGGVTPEGTEYFLSSIEEKLPNCSDYCFNNFHIHPKSKAYSYTEKLYEWGEVTRIKGILSLQMSFCHTPYLTPAIRANFLPQDNSLPTQVMTRTLIGLGGAITVTPFIVLDAIAFVGKEIFGPLISDKIERVGQDVQEGGEKIGEQQDIGEKITSKQKQVEELTNKVVALGDEVDTIQPICKAGLESVENTGTSHAQNGQEINQALERLNSIQNFFVECSNIDYASQLLTRIKQEKQRTIDLKGKIAAVEQEKKPLTQELARLTVLRQALIHYRPVQMQELNRLAKIYEQQAQDQQKEGLNHVTATHTIGVSEF